MSFGLVSAPPPPALYVNAWKAKNFEAPPVFERYPLLPPREFAGGYITVFVYSVSSLFLIAAVNHCLEVKRAKKRCSQIEKPGLFKYFPSYPPSDYSRGGVPIDFRTHKDTNCFKLFFFFCPCTEDALKCKYVPSKAKKRGRKKKISRHPKTTWNRRITQQTSRMLTFKGQCLKEVTVNVSFLF